MVDYCETGYEVIGPNGERLRLVLEPAPPHIVLTEDSGLLIVGRSEALDRLTEPEAENACRTL
jgi:hypothetical protein